MKRFLLLAALCGFTLAAMADDMARQRALFEAKYREVLKGATPRAETLAALRGYPLTPWLSYYPLKRNLRALPAQQVRAFVAAHAGSLPAERLRTDWLRETARQGRFDLFNADYTPQADPELRCHALRRDLDDGNKPRAVKAGLELWLTGKSQAPGCNAVFEVLRARGALTDALVWQRVMLAAKGGNTSLAVVIAKRYGAPSDRVLADLLHKVHGTPAQTLKLTAGRPDSPQLRDVIAHGLGRYAHQGLASATLAWRQVRDRYAFTPAQAGVVQRDLAVAAVAATHSQRLDYLRDVNDAGVDDAVERFRLREGLRARAWKDLVVWTAGAPRGSRVSKRRSLAA